LGLDISRENKYMAAIIEMSISRGQEIGFPAPIWKGLNITIVDDSDIRLGLYSIIKINLRVEICTVFYKSYLCYIFNQCMISNNWNLNFGHPFYLCWVLNNLLFHLFTKKNLCKRCWVWSVFFIDNKQFLFWI
jgi:hypothetical protein